MQEIHIFIIKRNGICHNHFWPLINRIKFIYKILNRIMLQKIIGIHKQVIVTRCNPYFLFNPQLN